MAAIKKLAKFTVTEAGEDFGLYIEDEAGRVLELIATRDQIDLIADSLDDFLSRDDSADEIDDDAEDDEEVDGDEIDDEEIDDDDLVDEEDGEVREGEIDGKPRRP